MWDLHANSFASNYESMVDWEGNIQSSKHSKRHINDHPVLDLCSASSMMIQRIGMS